MKAKDGQGGDGHEAARLLAAYLRHVESNATRSADEPIVLVLPDTEVADRRRKATRRASSATGGKNKSAG